MTTMDDLDPQFNYLTMNSLGSFDENAIYKVKELEDPNPVFGTTWLDLYEQQDEREGAVRTTTEGDASGSGQLIISEERSDYSLGVERLVWVDGYRQTTGDGVDKKGYEAMTLVVLRLSFETSRHGSENKIRFAETELRFQSDKKSGLDPKVVAWGPFRHPETWNVSKSHNKVDNKADASITAGGAGQQLSLGVGREEEKSWDQIDYDQGTSTRVYSVSKKKPHGVRWTLQENQLYKKGIKSEVRVAVLLSREQSAQAYRATLRIAVHTSSLGALMHRGESVLRLPVGKEVQWRATPKPGSKEGCFDEGCDIVKSIDMDNLGELIQDPSDSTNLNPSWLNPHHRSEVLASGVSPKADTEASGITEVVSAAAGVAVEAAVDSQKNEAVAVNHSTGSFLPRASGSTPPTVTLSAAGLPAHADHGTAGNKSEAPTGICFGANMFSPPHGVDHQGYSRLVSLEARAAQAEARLAAQDILISKLQNALATWQGRADLIECAQPGL